MRLTLFLVAGLLAVQAAAHQPTAPEPFPSVAPDRLAAARRLQQAFDTSDLPRRYVAQFATQVTDTITRRFKANPKYQQMTIDDPRTQPILDGVEAGFVAVSQEAVERSLPFLSEARARVYARRLSLAQLQEVATFLRTPTGKLYLRGATPSDSLADTAGARAFIQSPTGRAFSAVSQAVWSEPEGIQAANVMNDAIIKACQAKLDAFNAQIHALPPVTP